MKTILLVDDEYAFVESLAGLLQDEGYRVVSAANGKDGLARAEVEKPNLIVTDFMMPIGDGRELVRALRLSPQFQSTPVIMLSATTRAVALSDASGTLDVSAFLAKPVSWENLHRAIVDLLGPGDAPLPR